MSGNSDPHDEREQTPLGLASTVSTTIGTTGFRLSNLHKTSFLHVATVALVLFGSWFFNNNSEQRLGERLAVIEKDIVEIRKDIDELKTDVRDIKGTITELTGRVGYLEGQIDKSDLPRDRN